MLAPLKAAGDLPTQGRARAGSASSRLSTVFRRTASKPATPTPSSSRRRRHCRGRFAVSVPRHAAVVDNLKSHGRSRLASMPVRRQFNVTELAAAGKQADLETERLRLKAQESCRVGAREDAAAATAATQVVSSERLNSLALRVAAGKCTQEICRSFEV